ncbi:major facilitator superfamily domain-containing protein [Zopfochytrium polystomum]|nr:major facilitator superfamily domain-containing protein [Zopfochytrium polystomum]
MPSPELPPLNFATANADASNHNVDAPNRPPSRGSVASTHVAEPFPSVSSESDPKKASHEVAVDVNETNVVDWDGPEDPENPRNWSKLRKWIGVAIVGIFTLMTAMGSSVVAPSVPYIAIDLSASTTLQKEMIISIYVLSFGLGPLLVGPLSEIYGRRWLMIICNAAFLVFNIACSFATSYTQMLIFRFLAALGGSGPIAIGAGVISDMFSPKEFGVAVNMYSLAPLLGPAVGPLIGSLITQNSSWHWVFQFISICDAVALVFGFFYLKESYAPAILESKAARLRKTTGNDALVAAGGGTSSKSFATVLAESIKRPFILLFTQPIVMIISLYMAYLYGILYLVIATFTQLWVVRYHETLSISGLHYLALGIGLLGGTLASGPVMDRIYLNLREKNGGVGVPEHRLPITIPLSFVLPIGLFMYGWTAQQRVFWLAPDVGMMLFGLAFTIEFQALAVYVVDGYRRYAASAMAAASFLRSVAGFAFPLFAQDMYDKLDYGWGNSVLGFVAVACIPASFLLYKYGGWLRSRSSYAAG